MTAASKEAKAAMKAARRKRMRRLISAAAATPIDPEWECLPLLCSKQDPVIFEPADNTTCPPRSDYAAINRARHAQAVRFCLACPVKADCLATALRRGSTGTWGGELITSDDWESAMGLKREYGL